MILQVLRRSIHYFNFNFYEWMAKNLGLTGTLRWSLRFTALEVKDASFEMQNYYYDSLL